jgi:hypothetical protein
MKQTLKGMFAGMLMALALISFYNVSVLHAEWYNSRAPDSDSSNLRSLKNGIERIADELGELVAIQKELLEIERAKK